MFTKICGIGSAIRMGFEKSLVRASGVKRFKGAEKTYHDKGKKIFNTAGRSVYAERFLYLECISGGKVRFRRSDLINPAKFQGIIDAIGGMRPQCRGWVMQDLLDFAFYLMDIGTYYDSDYTRQWEILRSKMTRIIKEEERELTEEIGPGKRVFIDRVSVAADKNNYAAMELGRGVLHSQTAAGDPEIVPEGFVVKTIPGVTKLVASDAGYLFRSIKSRKDENPFLFFPLKGGGVLRFREKSVFDFGMYLIADELKNEPKIEDAVRNLLGFYRVLSIGTELANHPDLQPNAVWVTLNCIRDILEKGKHPDTMYELEKAMNELSSEFPAALPDRPMDMLNRIVYGSRPDEDCGRFKTR